MSHFDVFNVSENILIVSDGPQYSLACAPLTMGYLGYYEYIMNLLAELYIPRIWY